MVGGAWFIYQGVTTSLRAEKTLHATRLTIALVEEYVKQTGGAWPRSWNDLKEVPARSRGMYEWPEDEEELKQRVMIDFTADPAELAKQSPEEFEAIKPIGPNYGYKDYAASLLKTVSQATTDR